jgi:hypothetical protein
MKQGVGDITRQKSKQEKQPDYRDKDWQGQKQRQNRKEHIEVFFLSPPGSDPHLSQVPAFPPVIHSIE